MKKLNLNEKTYKFDLSKISDEDWNKFMFDVLLARLDNVRVVKSPMIRPSIRDNVAKVQISWNEVKSYHEFTFHVDEFGRQSKKYQDLVSNVWQNLMTEYYQEEYVQELNVKLDEVNAKTI